MTGGRPVWVLETVMTDYGSGMWGPEWYLPRLENTVSQGHTVIARVQPSWGKAFPLPGDTNPSMEEFLDQVGGMAELFKDVCHIWHLGNEMNLDFEWGDQQLQPEDYIDAAAQFSDRIHEMNSSLGPQIVLVGPVSPGRAEGVRWMSSTDYVTRMCNAINDREYRGKFEGFAIHAYGTPFSDDVNTSLYEFQLNPEGGFRHQLNILDNRGFENYPVYITEWNRKTNNPDTADEGVSARFLYIAMANIDAWNRVGGHPIVCACWFVYHDWGGWENYSIRSLKSAEGTRDTDVWHAFRYAAEQMYPAGYPAHGGGLLLR
jgi:hypothetical protein